MTVETLACRGFNCASHSPVPPTAHLSSASTTWQVNIGIPPEIVAERVNAGLDGTEQHYDKESLLERMERRRRKYIERMEITNDTNRQQ